MKRSRNREPTCVYFSLENAVCKDSYRRQRRERAEKPIAPALIRLQESSQTAFSAEKMNARGLGVPSAFCMLCMSYAYCLCMHKDMHKHYA